MSLSVKPLSILTNLINPRFGSRFLHCSKRLEAVVAFNLSDIGEGIREVVVKEWFVKPGDKVAQFDNICEVQSDKASVTITSRYDGTVSKLHYKIDEIALVGKPLIDIDTDNAESAQTEIVKSETIVTEPKVPIEERRESNDLVSLAIPSVRRLAKEHKIDLSKIKGTGKSGRILKEDVLAFLERKPQPKVAEDRIEPIKGFQKAMVKSMNESLKIPHFVYSDEIKLTALSKLRKELKGLSELDIKITFMPFFIKAASNALLKYPILNSSVDENCENIIFKKDHNIGIAMDTKTGLAVPVIKNVQSLSILEIATELNRLLKNGKNGTFSPSDLTGATFTISNIGIIGGTYMSPIILSPNVAIVAIGASKLVPRYDAQMNIVPEEIACFSGAADHRIVDGATMANFITKFKTQIENPNLLFLNF